MCRLPPLTERPDDMGRLAMNMPDYVNMTAGDLKNASKQTATFNFWNISERFLAAVFWTGVGLGDHEWMKHGSCSNMDAQHYIDAALDSLEEIGHTQPLIEKSRLFAQVFYTMLCYSISGA